MTTLIRNAISAKSEFYDWPGKLLFVGSLIWIFSLFYVSHQSRGIHSPTLVSQLEFGTFHDISHVTSWLPLAQKVSEGNLFPLSPAVDQSLSGFAFYPYLGLWAHGLLIVLFGMAGAMWVGQILLPTMSYTIIYVIFRRSLSPLWSATLGFLALISYTDLPLRDFVVAFFSLKMTPHTFSPLEVSAFPFPALSVLAFLACFYFSTQLRRLSFSRVSVITAMWALQTQIHPINAALGLGFWFLYFPYVMANQTDSRGPSLLKTMGYQVLIAVILSAPAAYAYLRLSEMNGGSLNHLDAVNPAQLWIFGRFYYAAYFGVPLSAALFLFWQWRLDPKEILHRFCPVVACLIVECGLIAGHFSFGLPIAPELVFSHLGMLFLHFYYLVPVIHFMERPLTLHWKYDQTLKGICLVKFPHWVALKASLILNPILLLLITVFCLSQLQVIDRAHRNFSVATDSENQLQLLKSGLKAPATLVSQSAIINLLIPIQSSHHTLLVNRFSNDISQTEVVSRLALYYKILNRTEADFVQFLSPGAIQHPTPNKPISLSLDHLNESGLGYWLVHHKRVFKHAEDWRLFVESSKSVFSKMSLSDGMKFFKVARVLTQNPPPDSLTNLTVEKLPSGYLWKVNP